MRGLTDMHCASKLLEIISVYPYVYTMYTEVCNLLVKKSQTAMEIVAIIRYAVGVTFL